MDSSSFLHEMPYLAPPDLFPLLYLMVAAGLMKMMSDSGFSFSSTRRDADIEGREWHLIKFVYFSKTRSFHSHAAFFAFDKHDISFRGHFDQIQGINAAISEITVMERETLPVFRFLSYDHVVVETADGHIDMIVSPKTGDLLLKAVQASKHLRQFNS